MKQAPEGLRVTSEVKAKARASVIREIVKPRAMNVVSTDMDDYLKSD